MRRIYTLLILTPGILGAGHAAEAPNEAPGGEIDWQKPIVSRGFGHAAQDTVADGLAKAKYQQGEVAYFYQNYGFAFQSWLPLAEQGMVDAQANIGWLYQAGLGVGVDYPKAREWYERAAAKGHAVAANNLGVLYEHGWGVPPDFSKAAAYYQRSAGAGYRFAQFNLGRAYLDGIGIAKDAAQAKHWLTLAAEQGVTQAADLLPR